MLFHAPLRADRVRASVTTEVYFIVCDQSILVHHCSVQANNPKFEQCWKQKS